jgi:hypothetical protein
VKENIHEDVPSTSKCGRCDYESDDEGDLRAHLESDHEEGIFKCETCGLVCKKVE